MNMMNMTAVKHSQIHPTFYRFITDEVLPLTAVEASTFWSDFEQLIADLAPVNRDLLHTRQGLQNSINDWHQEQQGNINIAKYQKFISDITYLQPPVDDFSISTNHVDDEIAKLAGPQLVVPITNARFALNAANARWGSLYDALYGTNVIDQSGELAPAGAYNEKRGQAVFDYSKDFLDKSFTLEHGSHHEVKSYVVYYQHLLAFLSDGTQSGLKTPSQFVALSGHKDQPSAIVLKNNGLHIELRINREGPIGRRDKAGIDDIIVESALTTIMDFEDSVATVDAEDKITAYRHWLGLMRGDLQSTFEKGGKTHNRELAQDKVFTATDGSDYTIKGRALLLVRNVGHLMDTELLQDSAGHYAPEGIVDAVVTALIGSIDLAGTRQNSQTGSIYIVKPKMHGPEEVAFTCQLFARVEDMLGLDRLTLKLGIMDEERRTTVNLKACIKEAASRLVFINTGFLDRTGDEIHTSMEAGPFLPKAHIKKAAWLPAYEQSNVDIGIACGLPGRAQIGKGMWAMPDEMADMMKQKIQHPLSGATTAWVPSPTAATLHALHYHQVDVFSLHASLAERAPVEMSTLLTTSLMQKSQQLTEQEIESELENNIQGILGYVVRWIDEGVGCSKVPDIHHIGLMEDRATLRISSQHIANWLHHAICTEQQVLAVMKRMTHVVDEQNKASPSYQKLAGNVENNLAFKAARDLIFLGRSQPNGYTEPLLHYYRQQAKQEQH